MSNRSRIYILSRILETADSNREGNGDSRRNDGEDGGVTRTKLIYQVFLSSTQLKRYLTVLTENNLLSHDSASYRFRTTEKGRKFLELCDKVNNLIKEEE